MQMSMNNCKNHEKTSVHETSDIALFEYAA